MTAEHNHPPRCCCNYARDVDAFEPVRPCPLCVEHGELAQLGKECPSCHTTDHPHTDYCQTRCRCPLAFDDDAPATMLGPHHQHDCPRYIGRRP